MVLVEIPRTKHFICQPQDGKALQGVEPKVGTWLILTLGLLGVWYFHTSMLTWTRLRR